VSAGHVTPRALDVVLSVRVAEALRDAAIDKISCDIPDARQGDDMRRAEILTEAVKALRGLDVEAVLDDLRARPVAAEAEAFDAAAKLASFNVARLDNGEFLHPITRRVHAVWKAAVRWAVLQRDVGAQARREGDYNKGENQ
jgi:hypothetical protein